MESRPPGRKVRRFFSYTLTMLSPQESRAVRIVPVLIAMVSLVLLGLLGCAAGGTPTGPLPKEPPSVNTGFLFRTIRTAEEDLGYVVYVPRGYAADRDWPAIVFLHGRGECGRDGLRHLTQGLGMAIMTNPDAWPCVVVMPQKPDPSRNWESYDDAVMGMLAAARAEFRLDADRISLTGLSQGGHGTWVLGSRQAGTWAALAPICGYGGERPTAVPSEDTARTIAQGIGRVPVWAFHGESDEVVRAAETRTLAAAVRANGGVIVETYYPGVGHNSWDNAYREEQAEGGLAAWLLRQRRPSATR
jgi:predicted peptidase